MSDNNDYIKKIVLKGLSATNKIQIVDPDHLVDSSDAEAEKNHSTHYIGQRHYITNYVNSDENSSEGTIEIVDIDVSEDDRGSIFDKSKNSKGRAIVKIEENVNVIKEPEEGVKEGEEKYKYKHNYIAFQAANPESGFYSGKYENDIYVKEVLEENNAPPVESPQPPVEATESSGDASEAPVEDDNSEESKRGSKRKIKVKTESKSRPERHKEKTRLPEVTSLGTKKSTDGGGNAIEVENERVINDFYKSREVAINVGSVIDSGTNDVGTSVWDGNNWDNSIKTNVDEQDNRLLDDIEGAGDLSNMGDALKNQAKNLTNQIGVISDVKKIVNRISGKWDSSERPDGTSSYENSKLTVLEKAKSEKYKNIKMTSKIGTYNSIENLLGGAAGMFVGSLGKSMLANMVDDMTSKFTGGVGVAGIVDNLGASLESMPSVEEILALNLANYYNMYTAKPGRIVTDRYRKYNFITQNISDKIDGSKGGKDSAREKVQAALNKFSGWINTASDFVAGKSLADGNSFISKSKREETEKKWEEYIEKSRIISKQRTDLEVVAGSQMKAKEESTNGRASLGGYSFDVVKNWDRQAKFFKEPHSYSNEVNEFKARMRDYGLADLDSPLGGLYIEPYYSGGEILPDFIPFEFNPTINDGGVQAKYQAEELMGRLLSVRSYISTDSNSVTINTKYLATSAPATDSIEEVDNHFPWLANWTPEYLREIEKQYRKLVYPFISGNVFVRPPIVRIKFGYGAKKERVSDLFSYPNIDGVLEVTNNLEGATREKRYVVTSVVINPISQEDYASSYFIDPSGNQTGTVSYRRGFSVDLTLMETTKNFLDTVPNYYHYERPPESSMAPGEHYVSKNNELYNKDIEPELLYNIPNLPEFDFFAGGDKPTQKWLDNVLDGNGGLKIKITDDNFLVKMFELEQNNKGVAV